MTINVPESVFQKYYDVIDSTFSIFGVDCQLVYIETVEEISNSFDNIPQNNSINAHKKSQNQYRRDDKVIKEVEKTEPIRLKVYWDRKQWQQVTSQVSILGTQTMSNIVIPDNSIQTIFFATDLQRISTAKELIVHDKIKDLKEMRFKKFGEPFPMGLRQNRYFGCFWERSV